MASTADLVAESTADLAADKKTFWKMSCGEKWRYTKKVITVEPVVACYMMAGILCLPTVQNLELEKACRVNLGYNDTVCDAVLRREFEEYAGVLEELQIATSNLHSWVVPVQSIVPLVLVIFFGSYSDRHHIRKPFMILPMVGEMLSCIGCILCVIFMDEWPLEVQGFFQSVLPSFFGGQAMLTMAVFSYIGDVSTLEMRTIRVGIVVIVLNVCVPVTEAYSGLLYAEIGYIGIFSVAVALFLVGILYGAFCIDEKREKMVMEKGFIADVFNLKHVVDTFSLLLKKSESHSRILINGVLFVMLIFSMVFNGEMSILFSYVTKAFQWTPVEYSYFLTIDTVVHLIGNSIGVALFTKCLKMNDWMILIIAFINKIGCNIIYGLAKTYTVFYTASICSIFTGIISIALRSLGTKVVSEKDMGKAQSLSGIFEALGPVIGAPLYNNGIYVNTLETLPSAYFYFGSIVFFVCIFILIFFYIIDKKWTQKVEQDNQPNEKYVIKDIQTTHM